MKIPGRWWHWRCACPDKEIIKLFEDKRSNYPDSYVRVQMSSHCHSIFGCICTPENFQIEDVEIDNPDVSETYGKD